MPGSTTWTFTQLGGDLKTLQLDGWSAPFGRPRRDPIVEDAIEIRQSTVYYPGDDTGPTRHIFGRKYTPRKLKGRFRDRWGGKGYANAKIQEVKAFVADAQSVRVQWSDQVSETIFLTKFAAGRESEGESTWEIEYDCDSDDNAVAKPFLPNVQEPASMVLSLSDPVTVIRLLNVPNVVGSLFAAMSALIDRVVGAAALIVGICDGIESWEDAAVSDLSRIIATVAAFRSACNGLSAFFMGQTLLVSTDAKSNVALWSAQTAADEWIRSQLAQASAIERQAQIALSSKPARSVVAQMGDTWEAIAIRVYGGADRAGDLWSANGKIEAPVAGWQYVVPQ